MNNKNYVLAGLAMITAVVGAFMYLRIVMAMYVDNEEQKSSVPSWHWSTKVVVIAMVGFTLLAGLVPQFLIEFAEDAVPILIRG